MDSYIHKSVLKTYTRKSKMGRVYRPSMSSVKWTDGPDDEFEKLLKEEKKKFVVKSANVFRCQTCTKIKKNADWTLELVKDIGQTENVHDSDFLNAQSNCYSTDSAFFNSDMSNDINLNENGRKQKNNSEQNETDVLFNPVAVSSPRKDVFIRADYFDLSPVRKSNVSKYSCTTSPVLNTCTSERIQVNELSINSNSDGEPSQVNELSINSNSDGEPSQVSESNADYQLSDEEISGDSNKARIVECFDNPEVSNSLENTSVALTSTLSTDCEILASRMNTSNAVNQYSDEEKINRDSDKTRIVESFNNREISSSLENTSVALTATLSTDCDGEMSTSRINMIDTVNQSFDNQEISSSIENSFVSLKATSLNTTVNAGEEIPSRLYCDTKILRAVESFKIADSVKPKSFTDNTLNKYVYTDITHNFTVFGNDNLNSVNFTKSNRNQTASINVFLSPIPHENYHRPNRNSFDSDERTIFRSTENTFIENYEPYVTTSSDKDVNGDDSIRKKTNSFEFRTIVSIDLTAIDKPSKNEIREAQSYTTTDSKRYSVDKYDNSFVADFLGFTLNDDDEFISSWQSSIIDQGTAIVDDKHNFDISSANDARVVDNRNTNAEHKENDYHFSKIRTSYVTRRKRTFLSPTIVNTTEKFSQMKPHHKSVYRNSSIKTYSSCLSVIEGKSLFANDNTLRLLPGKKWRRSMVVLKGLRDGINFADETKIKGRNWQKCIEELVESQVNNEQSVYYAMSRCSDLSVIEQMNSQFMERSRISSLWNYNDNILPSRCLITIKDQDAEEMILRSCNQEKPLTFNECFPGKCTWNKIGEGVYGEVFSLDRKNCRTVVKIIPIEGKQLINECAQKKFNEIIAEIIVSMELSNLRRRSDYFTDSFCELVKCRYIHGRYPAILRKLWEEYDEEKGSENDNPSVFKDDQLYICLELTDGGKDLEAFEFTSAQQALSVFRQVVFALAVAEKALEFEHRDLHWGNILVSRTSKRESKYRIAHKKYTFKLYGVKATIIDFTLSRITYSDQVICTDLEADPDLFTADGDFQFEVYRLMRREVEEVWCKFAPKTNVYWMHYLLDKLINQVNYKRTGLRFHQQCLDTMKNLRNVVDESESCYCLINRTELYS